MPTFRSLRRRGLATLALAVPLALVGTASHADAICRSVDGRYVEHDASGPNCTSPVGLCIAGTYSGDLKGPFAGSATTFTTTADTPATAVALFTSESTITARFGGRTGTLLIRNAGAFRGAGTGSIVDLQTIVGGTGDLVGATGDLRATGTFSFVDGGTSTWEGTICLPR